MDYERIIAAVARTAFSDVGLALVTVDGTKKHLIMRESGGDYTVMTYDKATNKYDVIEKTSDFAKAYKAYKAWKQWLRTVPSSARVRRKPEPLVAASFESPTGSDRKDDQFFTACVDAVQDLMDEAIMEGDTQISKSGANRAVKDLARRFGVDRDTAEHYFWETYHNTDWPDAW